VALGNLLAAANDGVHRPMYASVEARNAAIEAGSKHAKGILVAQVRAASRDFAMVARSVPLERWDVEVEWMSGRRAPAWGVLSGRLREIEVHHVDLDAGYTPADWPPDFVAEQLAEAADALSGRDGAPEVLLASGEQGSWRIAGAGEAVTVTGPAPALLAWVLGRSAGEGLDAPGGVLPKLPGWP
jgi:maleylpyruvate isomerase